MFAATARIHDKPLIRVFLILFALAATGPILWGALFSVGLALGQPSNAPLNWKFLVGLGVVAGVLAGWLRVLVKNDVLQRSRGAFLFTVTGLSIGVGIGAAGLLGWVGAPLDNSMFWAFFAVTLVGCFLLAAAIGARKLPPNSTVERDGPQAARPSL